MTNDDLTATQKLVPVTVWKKPAGAPDIEFERFGDFANDGAAIQYLGAECTDPAFEYTTRCKFIEALPGHWERTPLPSELDDFMQRMAERN